MIPLAGLMPAQKEECHGASFTHQLSFIASVVALPGRAGLGDFASAQRAMALTHGMAVHAGGIIDTLHFIPDRDTTKPKLPPPPPFKPEEAGQVKAVEPVFRTVPEQGDDHGITTTSSRPDDHLQQPPATGIDRAPAGVMATHTRPPYPLLAQRLGAVGKVTLRLTVLADGRVGQAEIVTSSGRSDLDDTARDWIIDHWTYKPALKDGQPATGQTLATVVFSLRNER
jgi:TonB family protein